ncbi:MAG: shikimate kinase [Collinsella sp.]|nr:shikimate kinase [Collinsella sp.]
MPSSRPHGVLGRTLGHSYTPAIYRTLAGLDYRRFECEPEDLEAFLKGDGWEGVNVTIPYKRAVLPYLDELSEVARRLGNVNTITRLPNGGLKGDNTDYHGFKVLVESLGMDLEGKRALVFGGGGGAGSTCMTVLADLGMRVDSVGRSGALTYDDLARGLRAELAVNCTPVGMYPSCPASVCRLDAIEGLEGLVDIVYNPARTGLMMQAEELGIASVGGLLMLVAQAARAVELYTGESVSLERTIEVTRELSRDVENIALIGMPGCGKTRVGQNLARLLDREHVDLDAVLASEFGCPCGDFIVREGEDAFRDAETRVLASVSKRSGLVISTGGGIVTRPDNRELLHQNSRIVMLDRPLDELSRKGRPLTLRDGVEGLAKARMPLYRAWADEVIASRETAEQTARAIIDSVGLASKG